jgi:hypothetical protein
MTLSLLMYGMMAGAFVALIGALVAEVLGSPVKVSLRTRLTRPVAGQRHRRVRHDPDCPQRAAGAGSSLIARGASRSRWRATPGSCGAGRPDH